jgi:hypothetical protein
MIVTGGALGPAGRWRRVRSRRYLFPVGVMSTIFRGKFLAGLTALKEENKVPAPPKGWPHLWKTLGASTWNVYCKRPFAGPQQVLSYLSNYTHRVAISERRIEAINPAARTVTFRWRDYREKDSLARCNGAKCRPMSFSAVFASTCCPAASPRSGTMDSLPTMPDHA